MLSWSRGHCQTGEEKEIINIFQVSRFFQLRHLWRRCSRRAWRRWRCCRRWWAWSAACWTSSSSPSRKGFHPSTNLMFNMICVSLIPNQSTNSILLTNAKFWPHKKLKISWISFLNVFSTFQFSHLAREKISQKTHKSNYFTNCKNFASKKLRIFWSSFVNVFSTFQFSTWPERRFPRFFFTNCKSFASEKNWRYPWILFVSGFLTFQFSAWPSLRLH